MWRFKAPLSGRSGEIRSTDGPSRLNISVTLFPNCVVVPEAGTAVRAKQSGGVGSPAVYGIHINMPVSHGITILSAPRCCCLYCSWILHSAPCFLPSVNVYLACPRSSLGELQVACYMPTSLSCFTSPSLYDFFLYTHNSPCTHTTSTHGSVTSNIWCVQTLHISLALTPWTRVHTLFRTWASHLRLNVPSHSRAPRPSIWSSCSSQSTPFTSFGDSSSWVPRQLLLTTFRCSLFSNAYFLRHPGPSIFRAASSLKCNNK